MSALEASPPVKISPVHELRDGRECHYFVKKVQPGFQDIWECDCGEVRDSFGQTLAS